MSVCSLSFLLIVSLYRMYSSGYLSEKRRKFFQSEENPQMEWDDSGLNITENPLDSLAVSWTIIQKKLNLILF